MMRIGKEFFVAIYFYVINYDDNECDERERKIVVCRSERQDNHPSSDAGSKRVNRSAKLKR